MIITKDYTFKNVKGPTSERALYIQQAADLTGMTWKVMFGKTLHLQTHWIKNLLDDCRSGKGDLGRKKYFWYLLKKTKPVIIKPESSKKEIV